MINKILSILGLKQPKNQAMLLKIKEDQIIELQSIIDRQDNKIERLKTTNKKFAKLNNKKEK